MSEKRITIPEHVERWIQSGQWVLAKFLDECTNPIRTWDEISDEEQKEYLHDDDDESCGYNKALEIATRPLSDPVAEFEAVAVRVGIHAELSDAWIALKKHIEGNQGPKMDIPHE